MKEGGHGERRGDIVTCLLKAEQKTSGRRGIRWVAVLRN